SLLLGAGGGGRSPPTSVACGAMAFAAAALGLALVLPLAGKTVAIDPGHNGGNAAHAAEIARLVDAGTLRKACDTVGTSTDDGYAEHAYTFDVSMRLARALRSE